MSAKKHILIVDDNREILRSLRVALTKDGFTVSVARDGNEAIVLVESLTPDLVILDLMMPKRSGLLVLEHLRRSSDHPVPIIMITGNRGVRHQEYAKLLGVDDYIHKPFNMSRLLASVSSLVSIQQNESAESSIL